LSQANPKDKTEDQQSDIHHGMPRMCSAVRLQMARTDNDHP
jgi:hypothetical protein